jgi:hypothetical protein
MLGIALTHNVSGLYCALFVVNHVATQLRRLGKEMVLIVVCSTRRRQIGGAK